MTLKFTFNLTYKQVKILMFKTILVSTLRHTFDTHTFTA
jgi:hypothetical protein